MRPSPAAAKRLLVLGPSLVAERGSLGHSGISTCSPQAQYSCHMGLVVRPHVGPSWTRVGPLPMHWPMDSYRLHHQQSPYVLFLYNIFVEFVTVPLLFTFWFFGCRTYGSLGPQPRIRALPATLESQVLTTRRQGSPINVLNNEELVRWRWLDGLADSRDMSLSKRQEIGQGNQVYKGCHLGFLL